ncbi:unnamed protein product [Closterium sp. NIES-53]
MVVRWATTDPTEGSAKAKVTGMCSGVRSVQSRKKQLDAPESRGPMVEAPAGAAAVPAVAAAAVVTAAAVATVAAATAAAAATAVAAIAAAAGTGAAATAYAAATIATSKWHVISGVGANRSAYAAVGDMVLVAIWATASALAAVEVAAGALGGTLGYC